MLYNRKSECYTTEKNSTNPLPLPPPQKKGAFNCDLYEAASESECDTISQKDLSGEYWTDWMLAKRGEEGERREGDVGKKRVTGTHGLGKACKEVQ